MDGVYGLMARLLLRNRHAIDGMRALAGDRFGQQHAEEHRYDLADVGQLQIVRELPDIREDGSPFFDRRIPPRTTLSNGQTLCPGWAQAATFSTTS
jgi:hypothetical protein